jgi:hypothetical protein
MEIDENQHLKLRECQVLWSLNCVEKRGGINIFVESFRIMTQNFIHKYLNRKFWILYILILYKIGLLYSALKGNNEIHLSVKLSRAAVVWKNTGNQIYLKTGRLEMSFFYPCPLLTTEPSCNHPVLAVLSRTLPVHLVVVLAMPTCTVRSFVKFSVQNLNLWLNRNCSLRYLCAAFLMQ